MMSRNFEGKLNYSDFNDFAWKDALLLKQKIFKSYSQIVLQVQFQQGNFRFISGFHFAKAIVMLVIL